MHRRASCFGPVGERHLTAENKAVPELKVELASPSSPTLQVTSGARGEALKCSSRVSGCSMFCSCDFVVQT